MNLSNAQADVRAFQKAFNLPYEDAPKMLTAERLKFRQELLQEEVDEISAATTLEDLADGIGDVIYIALGTAIESGIEMEPIFKIIQAANMAKLGEDGKPIYREDGKVIKPEGWQPPEPAIVEELERQKKGN